MHKLLIVSALSLVSFTAAAATTPACDAVKHDANTGFTECETLKISYMLSIETPLKMKLREMERARNEFIQSLADNYPGKVYEQPSQRYPAGRVVDPQAAAPKP